MTIKQFEDEIKWNSEQGFALSRRDISKYLDKYLSHLSFPKRMEKSDKILRKHGYAKATWIEYKKRLGVDINSKEDYD